MGWRSCVPYVASFSVLFFVLCTLCCQFLCVFLRLVYPMLPVSLCFSSSCVPYVKKNKAKNTNIICVGDHCTQTNINNVNKT
jgi:hypothetical protein